MRDIEMSPARSACVGSGEEGQWVRGRVGREGAGKGCARDEGEQLGQLGCRQVTQEPRYIFDAFLPGFVSGDTFMLLDGFQETYTDFDDLSAQYAAFYFRLGSEMVKQRRSQASLFALFEMWGALGAFLYFTFGLAAQRWNSWHFQRQTRGLDIRKLDKGQFTKFGRLIDKSFQMPREYQGMSAD